MAESRIKDENYYQISGFMIKRLGLKGVPLSVYAIIYGFTQDGETEFKGSLQYLCDFCGGVSKPTIIKALKDLTQSGYILRREEFVNGVQFNRYKANLPLLKNLYYGIKENTAEVVKNFEQGSKETLPNNISDNNTLNNKRDISAEFETLWKLYPRKLGKEKAKEYYAKAAKSGVTFEQVEKGIKAYCQQIKAEKTELAFIKHGSTWFNGKCWNDEYTTAPEEKPAQKYDLKGGMSL